ncbi:MAG: glycosyltransferase family 9 protein [Gammaproteobacteria bacterium]|nr:glycosyltransferase family 9 protein [Gammaproteobacteria bacterium]
MSADPPRVLDLPAAGEVERILIMRWSAMGDVALASAAMQDVREAFPDATIHLNTLPPWDALFAEDPRFEKILAVDVRGAPAGIGGMLRWIAEVRRTRYDLLVDLQSNDRSRILVAALWASGGAPRYRVATRRRFPYNIGPAPGSRPVHALDHMRAALASAGIRAGTQTPVLFAPAESRQRMSALKRDHAVSDGDYAVFLPGCQAAGYLKRWGALRYIALAKALRARGLGKVLLLGAADEETECREIQAACGEWVLNCCGLTAPLDIIPLCEQARLVVANDTGTAHIAAAAGRPMVVVCGPTDPRRVKPAGPSVEALQAQIFCAGCYRKHCSHHSCMLLVTPDQVMARLEALGALG